jgi:hypothetical protein
VVNIDSSGKFFDLAFERDGPPAVPLAHFQAEQLVAPPGGLGGVRMGTAPGDGNQPATAQKQEVAVADRVPRGGQGDEFLRVGFHWRNKKARGRTVVRLRALADTRADHRYAALRYAPLNTFQRCA